VSFTWDHALPNIETALYFSAVTYTTTGYGDVVLPQGWRLQGGVEALTGILMCGWSTGFFFAVVNRLSEARSGAAAT
jgi:voltage-gated potassium channel Kch